MRRPGSLKIPRSREEELGRQIYARLGFLLLDGGSRRTSELRHKNLWCCPAEMTGQGMVSASGYLRSEGRGDPEPYHTSCN